MPLGSCHYWRKKLIRIKEFVTNTVMINDNLPKRCIGNEAKRGCENDKLSSMMTAKEH